MLKDMFGLRMPLMILALAMLAGCASSGPPATRYLLPSDAPAADDIPREVEHTLVIQPLRLAGYLDTAGIVLQLDDITLNEAEGHRWAEDLALQLQRGLRQRLAGLLPDTRVLSDGASLPGAAQLRVTVESFQGRHDGVAVAAGTWQLRGADGELLLQQPFLVETALESDGYPALVRALGRSWDGVADQIADAILGSREQALPSS